MFQKFHGLSFKLIFFIILCSAFIFNTTLFFNYKFSKQAVLSDINESANNLTFAISNRIDRVLKTAMHINEILAISLEHLKYSPEELNILLKSVIKEHDEIFGCRVALEPDKSQINHLNYYSHFFKKRDNSIFRDTVNQQNYLNEDWFNIPKTTEKPFWSEPFHSNSLNFEQVLYAVPFYKTINEKKIFCGVISVDISLEWIHKFCSSLKIFKTGYAFLLSSKGNYISHPFKESNFIEDIYSIAWKYSDTQHIHIGKAMIKGDTGIVHYKYKNNDYEGMVFYTPLTSSPWFLGVFLPEEELFIELNKLNSTLIFISLFGLIILLIVITIISKKITNPLKDLVTATNEISNGNYNTKLKYLKNRDEIGNLSRSFLKMQETLQEDIINLKITTAAKEKIESELQIAREIQKSILPHKFPAFPEKCEFDLYAVLQPARAVGGDLYDYFLIDSDHLCLAIGDVSGKGVPASLFMAGTEMLLRAKVYKVLPVNSIAKNINDLLYKNNDSKLFVTLFLCILNLKTGELDYFNAGHNPPFILRSNGETEKLCDTHCPPFGIMSLECDYFSTIKLNKDDQIILYTDGLTEAMNCDYELFSEKRLIDTLINLKNSSPQNTVESLLESVKIFSGNITQFDDIAVLALKYYSI